MRSSKGSSRSWLRSGLVGLGMLALLGACDSGTPDPLTVGVTDGTQGNYGGPCNPDGTCGAGLVCIKHVCKEKVD